MFKFTFEIWSEVEKRYVANPTSYKTENGARNAMTKYLSNAKSEGWETVGRVCQIVPNVTNSGATLRPVAI